MVEAYWRWVRMLDLDGFRIDTLKHVEHGFWQDFAARIRVLARAAGKRNFFMFGEAFDGDDRLVGSYTNPNEMDSVFYFPQKYRVFDNIFQCGDGRTADAEALLRDRQMNYSATPQPNGIGVAPRQALVNFMDNHDVSRFLYGMNPTVVESIRAGDGRNCASGVVDIRNPRDVERFRPRLLAALTYLLTEDGIPCIYYGTEQDFRGGNDPSNRERLWETNFSTAERRADGSFTTFGWTRRLIALRRTYPALRRGAMTWRWTTEHTGAEPDAGIMAFERVDGQQLRAGGDPREGRQRGDEHGDPDDGLRRPRHRARRRARGASALGHRRVRRCRGGADGPVAGVGVRAAGASPSVRLAVFALGALAACSGPQRVRAPVPTCAAVTHPGVTSRSLTWNGSGWGAVVPDGATLFLREFAVDGAVRGERVELVEERAQPARVALAWAARRTSPPSHPTATARPACSA